MHLLHQVGVKLRPFLTDEDQQGILDAVSIIDAEVKDGRATAMPERPLVLGP